MASSRGFWGISTAWQKRGIVEVSGDLKTYLQQYRGERHLVLLPNFPSPDEVAAAFAHRIAGQEHGIETDSVFSGRLQPRQNVAMVKMLGFELASYPTTLDYTRYQGMVIIGRREAVGRDLLEEAEAAGLPLRLTVDREMGSPSRGEEAGGAGRPRSISTSYALCLQASGVEMSRARKEHVSAATALLFGILWATENFVLANETDLTAAAYLSGLRDAELLEQIVTQVRSRQVMEIIRRALGDRITAESYSIAGIGYLRAEDREAVAHAAEFLLSEENVHTAIVYGIVRSDSSGEALEGAVRTSKVTILPQEFIEEMFSRFLKENDCPDYQITEDGFHIPVRFLAGGDHPRFKELKWQLYDAQVKQIIFDKIGVQQDVFTS
jgi:nanoRNase/pAp phosphatase (c-di-AMP/oligoRNAs hydrolase)